MDLTHEPTDAEWAALENDNLCAITQQPFIGMIGRHHTRVLPCGHMFDTQALEQYVRAFNTCPVCRAQIYEGAPEDPYRVETPPMPDFEEDAIADWEQAQFVTTEFLIRRVLAVLNQHEEAYDEPSVRLGISTAVTLIRRRGWQMTAYSSGDEEEEDPPPRRRDLADFVVYDDEESTSGSYITSPEMQLMDDDSSDTEFMIDDAPPAQRLRRSTRLRH